MTDADLIALAEQAGVAPRWRDYRGRLHDVAPPTLRAVLAATDVPAGSDAEIRDSRERLEKQQTGADLPPLIALDAGQPIALPLAPARYRITHEDGTTSEGTPEESGGRALLPAIDTPGYHRLEIGRTEITLAVAPSRCFSLADAGAGSRAWGLAVQLYSLRREGDGGIGDFSALRRFVRSAAGHGAAAVAISPVHAQFSADPDRFSPYAPSSRVALNVLHADTEDLRLGPAEAAAAAAARAGLEAPPLIDWSAAARARLARLRHVHRQFRAAPRQFQEEFARFRTKRPDLELHARFEALQAHLFGADPKRWHWRSWPQDYRDPQNTAVAAFASAHAEEVAFHLFLQFLAERELAGAQAAARAAGMPVGLIADLAVGTDSGGSHAWSRQDEMLIGLTVGAPPDLLNTQGQNWGVVAFSPLGLVRHGFAAFIEMLRAALRHAGGVRIDHAMGLARLWVVPDGADANEGAYLRFPLDDMLRLLALESRRHRGIVLGEDLGTVPEGFSEKLESRGVMGMRVLWFERGEDRFKPPPEWSAGAAAMTSTHDLPTVAGWWSGRDLEWRQRLNLLGDDRAVWFENENRGKDRSRLWQAFCASGAAAGEPPKPEEPAIAVDAAVRHVGRAGCELVMLPLEDALAEPEQPNLPGTLHEHPNWRRRTPAPADRLLDDPAVAARLAGLAEARRQ